MSENKKRSDYFFHPFEISFCGFSNSGKTTLISKVLSSLSSLYDIGYVKHDVHRFMMDKDGKDTFSAYESGAKQVFISDPRHSATIYRGTPTSLERKNFLLDNDFVILEGYKNFPVPKIVVIDQEHKILDLVRFGNMNHVLAFVGQNLNAPDLPIDRPYYHRDDLEGVVSFVLSYLNSLASKIPVFGLVLTGGKSSRMKRDKAFLSYHGRPQAIHTYELLTKHLSHVYISSKSDQWNDSALNRLPQIYDCLDGFGPMGGILSAMRKYPNAAWLVTACDLPFLDEKTVIELLSKRNPFKMATCYESNSEGLPEPLCAIYEPKIYSRLFEAIGNEVGCPRKVLLLSPTKVLHLPNPRSLENVNYPEEFNNVSNQLKGTSFEIM